MNHFIVLMSSLFLILSVGCDQKNGSLVNVRIRVGVVMKSGDVKNIARHDFLVSKANIFSLWETSLQKNKWDHSLIEKETQVELGYEAKLAAFQDAIHGRQEHINQLRAKSRDQFRSIKKQFSKHIEITYEKGLNYGVGYYFDILRIPTESFEIQLRDADKKYGEVSKYPVSQDAKDFLSERYAEFRGIKNQYESAFAQVAAEQVEIDKIGQERDAFIKNYEQTISEKEKVYFNNAKANFITEYKKNFITTFKTDLSGVAEAQLPKGECFFFSEGEIGLDYLVWNYNATITKEGQYIELSNDNALSSKKEEAAQIISILSGLVTK